MTDSFAVNPIPLFAVPIERLESNINDPNETKNNVSNLS